ncbi:hypothetical protein B0T20DRAFT_482424 [Sordaria brevicollis]|uniref:DUF3669 domain-containing protein n=1 Tax=Sordaria brevicollis TaxID=83679 RepID=A0AAE0P2T2_SORBR|nr:hypothetical protein B0T20DRAFT_482424 [Sordaria brevicollis]
MDSNGVNTAVKAFVETNPYCPKPNSSQPEVVALWEPFKRHYLEHSANILTHLNRPHHQSLPGLFISGLERQQSGATPTSTDENRLPFYVPTGPSLRGHRRYQSRSSTGGGGSMRERGARGGRGGSRRQQLRSGAPSWRMQRDTDA